MECNLWFTKLQAVRLFQNHTIRLNLTHKRNTLPAMVETSRMLDSPPRSRNEGLASLMRRMGFCEERGVSGYQ